MGGFDSERLAATKPPEIVAAPMIAAASAFVHIGEVDGHELVTKIVSVIRAFIACTHRLELVRYPVEMKMIHRPEIHLACHDKQGL